MSTAALERHRGNPGSELTVPKLSQLDVMHWGFESVHLPSLVHRTGPPLPRATITRKTDQESEESMHPLGQGLLFFFFFF